LVKDLRTGLTCSDAESVLDGGKQSRSVTIQLLRGRFFPFGITLDIRAVYERLR